MTPAELRAKVQSVIDALELGEGIAAGVFAPLAPYLVLAKVVENEIPGAVEAVANWIEGNPPTDAEIQDMTDKLNILRDPDQP